METETAPKPAVAVEATICKPAVNCLPVEVKEAANSTVEDGSTLAVEVLLEEEELVVVVLAANGVSKAVTTEVEMMEPPVEPVVAKMEIFMYAVSLFKLLTGT